MAHQNPDDQPDLMNAAAIPSGVARKFWLGVIGPESLRQEVRPMLEADFLTCVAALHTECAAWLERSGCIPASIVLFRMKGEGGVDKMLVVDLGPFLHASMGDVGRALSSAAHQAVVERADVDMAVMVTESWFIPSAMLREAGAEASAKTVPSENPHRKDGMLLNLLSKECQALQLTPFARGIDGEQPRLMSTEESTQAYGTANGKTLDALVFTAKDGKQVLTGRFIRTRTSTPRH